MKVPSEGANFREVPMSNENKGHRLVPRTMVPSQEYRDNWDRIFGEKHRGLQDEIEPGFYDEADETSENYG